MDYTINDFDNVCRTCLIKKENLIHIKSNKIVEMLMECASLEIKMKEPIPHQICSDCLEELIRAFHFKRRCFYSNEILEKIRKHANNDENLQEIIGGQLQEFWHQFVFCYPKILEKLKLEAMIHKNITEVNGITVRESPNLILKKDIKCISNVEVKENNRLSIEENDSLDSTVTKANESEEGNRNEQIFEELSKSNESRQISRNKMFINHAKFLDGTKCNIASLKCLICSKSFTNLITLARHLNIHSETRILTFKCKECGKGFADSNNLKKHTNRHQGNPQYTCNKCNGKFYDLSNLGWHMRKRHKVEAIKCIVCNMKLYHHLQQEQHDRLHEKKVCDICGKVCKTPKLVARHKILHSNVRPYSCEQCDKSFKTSEQLNIHKKVVHSGPLPRVACSVCGKSICYRNLTKHLKSHDKGTFYKCEYCPKGYYCEDTLKQHVRHKHTNEGCQFKWLCSICGRKVISPKDLKIHMKSHSEERLYSCNQCDKRYKTTGALNIHVRCAHEDKRPHKCSICTKAFHTKLILQNHMRTHTGERPFVCSVCGKAFGTKIVLKTHMKTHERP